jgi:hypothetical protein
MDIAEQISKLLKTDDEENYKLAENIILTRTNVENVIGILCAIKIEYPGFLLNDNIRDLINNSITSGYGESPKWMDTSTLAHAASDLYRAAITKNKLMTKCNIEWAYKVYQEYIKALHQEALTNAGLKTVAS